MVRSGLGFHNPPISDSSPPQTMVNTNKLHCSTAVAISDGMVLYEHIEDSQERVVSVMCIYTFANLHQVNTIMPGV